MTIFPLIGIAFLTAVASLLVKSIKPELSLAITLAGGIILLLFALDLAKDVLGIFDRITETTGISPVLVKTLLKMLGIGYLIEFTAGILQDFGCASLADKLVFCGKIIIFLLAVPILESALTLIVELLELAG